MVYDLTIHSRNIRRYALQQIDFAAHPELANENKLNKLVSKCENISQRGFSRLKLNSAILNEKKVYKVTSFEHELVLRLLTKKLHSLNGVRQTNRSSIVKSLNLLFQEGLDFKVFKFDIKNFYESIDIDDLLLQLENDKHYSRSHFYLLQSLFKKIQSHGIIGIPRGMAISATLSEFVMRNFDKTMNQKDSYYFYARFVDDIIIVTNPSETTKSVTKQIRNNLPSGLELNRKKTTSLTLNEQVLKKSDPSSLQCNINYLGYSFKIFKRKQTGNQSNIARVVHVDISNSKVNKIKTRIVKSCFDFCSNNDFDLFENRIKLLSGNYTIFDFGRKVKRKAGIYFNYNLVNPDESSGLAELDLFFRKILLAKNGTLCSQLQIKLTNNQRRKLLKHSFKDGFKNRVFYNFPAKKIVQLMRCWLYA